MPPKLLPNAPQKGLTGPAIRSAGVMLTPGTKNRKLGPNRTHALQLSHISCPPCRFRYNGCYALQGQMRWHSLRLNREAAQEGLDHLTLARQAAAAIERCPPTAPLRLFTAGDGHCAACTDIIAAAARTYAARSQQPVWGYTHTKDTTDAQWGPTVSVLASCEHPADVYDAWARGYAAAVVAPTFPNGARRFDWHGIKAIPCPAQTKNVSCADCQLCWRKDFLQRTETVVAFLPHGSGQRKVLATLPVIE